LTGSPADELGRDANEVPQRRVTLASIAMGGTGVTQAQWKALMGNNPSYFKKRGDNCPADRVRWKDAQDYIQRLNAKTGKTHALPSEALS